MSEPSGHDESPCCREQFRRRRSAWPAVFLLALFLSGTVHFSWATSYYVNPAGSDANPGPRPSPGGPSPKRQTLCRPVRTGLSVWTALDSREFFSGAMSLWAEIWAELAYESTAFAEEPAEDLFPLNWMCWQGRSFPGRAITRGATTKLSRPLTI